MRHFGGNKGLAVAVLCVAQFVVVLDITVVTSALPALGHELGFSAQGLPWVITVYTLCFGGFLVAGGRIADVLGSRRAFALGLVGFTGASLLCAVAGTPGLLLAFRALQGTAAALLSPAALALITATAESDAGRRRVVAIWTAAAACGGATGWLLGGVLSQYGDWRWVFGINVPIGLVVLPLVGLVLPRGPRQRSARLDLVGIGGVTLGLAAVVYGLTEVPEIAADPVRAVLPLVLGAGLLAVVLHRERRLADPLLPADLFAVREVRGANLVAAAVTASTTPAMYLAVLYLQNVVGLPAGQAALYFPVLNLAVIVGSFLGPKLIALFAARWTAAGGFGLIIVGCVVLTTLPAVGLASARLLTAFAAMGVGLGLASTASTTVGTNAAPASHRGTVFGLLNAAAQIGTALGLALVVPMVAAATAAGPPDLTGMRYGFAAAGVIAAAGLAVSTLLGARRKATTRAGAD
jgi:MFS family permease